MQSNHFYFNNAPPTLLDDAGQPAFTPPVWQQTESQVYTPHVPHAANFPTGGNQLNPGQLTPMSWSRQSLTSSFPPPTPTLTTAPPSGAGDLGSQDKFAPKSPKVTSKLIREKAPIVHKLLCWSQDMQIEDVFNQELGPWYDQECWTAYRELVDENCDEVFLRYTFILDGMGDQVRAHAQRPEDLFTIPQVSKVASKRLSSLRSKYKATAISKNGGKGPHPFDSTLKRDTGYKLLAFDDMGNNPSPETIKKRVADLLLNNAFLHDDSSDETNVQNYKNPLLYEVIKKTGYSGRPEHDSVPRSFVRGIKHYVDTYSPRVNPAFLTTIPDEAIALSAAAWKCALNHYATGIWKEVKFDKDGYLAFYHQVRRELADRRVEDPVWSREFDEFLAVKVAGWLL